MITFHNHLHAMHQGRMEMFRGQLVPCFEVPGRVDDVLARVRARNLGPVRQATDHDLAVLAGIHHPAYLHFLEHAWDDWVALDPANAGRDALPSVWPNHGLRTDVLPANFAASDIRFAAGSSVAIGFSTSTCLLAASASRTTASC